MRQDFWSKVDQSAGPTACWPWRNGLSAKGYGRATLNGRRLAGSRAAWILTHGDPGDLQDYGVSTVMVNKIKRGAAWV